MNLVRCTSLLWLLLLVACPWGLCPCAAQECMVQEWTVKVVSDDVTSMRVEQRKVLTIASERAARHASFVCQCSKYDKLKDFRGEVADADGRVIRKVKKGDLLRTEYSAYLAVDDYTMYFDYTPPTYPVTVTYEWTMESSDNVIEYPWFCPQSDYEVGVAHAVYELRVPRSVNVRHVLRNISAPLAESVEKDMQVLRLQLDNLPALHSEPFAPPLRERVPLAYFAPSQFSYYDHEGQFTDWAEYGLWENSLLQGRDELPAAVVEKVHQLTDGLPDERQKVERLYQYLGETTRYVAVLLGVGGQQPAPAKQVSSSGFGDCKGLSNYMRALLKEIGIPSYYTVISTTNRRLIPDFASAGQMNHVILQVPLRGDTLWLECTNPQIPFGYVHAGIAGHDAVTVSADGGRLVRLPVYADTANVLKNTLHVTLEASGAATLQLQQEACCRQMEDRLALIHRSDAELRQALQRMMRVPQSAVSETRVQSEGLSLTINATVQSQKYASANGQRLFVPLGPVLPGFSVPKVDGVRVADVHVGYGYQDEDDVTFVLPDGYEIEAMPAPVSVETPFGTFTMQLTVNGHTVRVTRRLLVKAGLYPREQYPQLADFLKAASAAYTQKMVLKRTA